MNPPRWNTRYADQVRGDLVQLVEHVDATGRSAAARRARGADRMRFVATGVVAALVAVAAVLAIRAGLDRPAQNPAAQPTHSTQQSARPEAEVQQELKAALSAILPPSARTAPALTWTDDRDSPTGGAIDTEGKTMLIAAACEGGGTITVTVTGSQRQEPDTVLQCSRLSTLGPIDLSAAGGTDPPGPVGFDVRVTSGHPRYFAKAVAVDSAVWEETSRP
ncbi:hypothetical protein [uncultured Amnibacterium sp.]|uniref:hypothetical protein n=1 Tax=uncultured Amnibacterium sp. TaxID=1631851 RepID=UPI0035CA4EDC